MADEQEEYAEKLLKSVNDAANAISSRLVTLMTVGAYVAVTVSATTDEMLLRANNRVPLPLLNIEIPIVGPFGFYSVAPWLILLLHSDLLLQLSILGNELDRFQQQLSSMSKQRQASFRQGMVNFYYVLYLSGGAPSPFLHFLSAFITWITAVALPLALLLWIQIRFLPVHSRLGTGLHAAAVLIDVILILFILMPRVWPLMQRAGSSHGLRATLRRVASVPVLIAGACLVTAATSLYVSIVPNAGSSASLFNMQLHEQVFTENPLGPEDINALRNPSEEDQLKKVLAKVRPLRALQGRDLRFANLERAVLPIVDLRALRTGEALDPAVEAECAKLRGCEVSPQCDPPGLQRAQLQGADFSWASMPGAMLNEALMDDAILNSAHMQDASLEGTHLNRATLGGANLQDARLYDAKLCGANLSDADLRRTKLDRAVLQGANLGEAKLIEAVLFQADLRGADLSKADLTKANLREARLQGAILHGAKTSGAIFDGPSLDLLTDVATDSTTTSLDAVTTYLADLACKDASAAYGIAAQVQSPHRDGRALARAFRDARSRECPGIASLPDTTQTLLDRLALE